MSTTSLLVQPNPLAPLTVREAAYVLHASEKRVNQAIDREKLRAQAKRGVKGRAKGGATRGAKSVRLISVQDLLEFAVHDQAAEYVAFTTAGRKTLHAAVQEALSGLDLSAGAPTTAAATPAVPSAQGVLARLKQRLGEVELQVGPVRLALGQLLEPVLPSLSSVAASRLAVVSDPEIRRGEPVVRDTRVPVYRLAELRAQGVEDEVLLADHPSLTPELLRQALLYAELHPRAGRPKRPAAPWQGGEPIARLAAGARRVQPAARKAAHTTTGGRATARAAARAAARE